MVKSQVTYPEIIIRELQRRIVNESIPRIIKCLSILSENQVWYKANANTNSVGHLVLHLCGNVRQWIFHGLDGQDDMRDRDLEFSHTGDLPKIELVNELEKLAKELTVISTRLLEVNLLAERKIQSYFTESGVSVIIHVIEHFSYHTGQITYYTKMINDIDTGYYAHLQL